MTFVHCGLEGEAHRPAGHRDCTILSSGHQGEPREGTVSPTKRNASQEADGKKKKSWEAERRKLTSSAGPRSDRKTSSPNRLLLEQDLKSKTLHFDPYVHPNGGPHPSPSGISLNSSIQNPSQKPPAATFCLWTPPCPWLWCPAPGLPVHRGYHCMGLHCHRNHGSFIKTQHIKHFH